MCPAGRSLRRTHTHGRRIQAEVSARTPRRTSIVVKFRIATRCRRRRRSITRLPWVWLHTRCPVYYVECTELWNSPHFPRKFLSFVGQSSDSITRNYAAAPKKSRFAQPMSKFIIDRTLLQRVLKRYQSARLAAGKTKTIPFLGYSENFLLILRNSCYIGSRRVVTGGFPDCP